MPESTRQRPGLTAAAVLGAKSKEKPYKLSDRDGLYLLIEPAGRRVWRMNYRFSGRQRTITFGRWPETPLSEARDLLLDARKLLAKGIDPAEQKNQDKIARSLAAASTFEAVAEEWIAKIAIEGAAPKTITKERWLLSMLYPAIGHRPIKDIAAHELLAALRKLEATQRYYAANRARSTSSRVFRYAIATARADRDIPADLRGALISPKPKYRAAITTPSEAAGLLRAIEGYDGQPLTRLAMQMLAHVFVRPGELRFAEWHEFDLDARVWTIPADKMKMRRPHAVPLTRQVLTLLEQIKHDAVFSPFLFPSIRSTKRPMSDNTINAALRRMGYDKEEMTAHGFRAMAATLLNEMGCWNPDAIERQLAHADGNSVRRAYARGQYWEERVRMMQHWSDHIEQMQSHLAPRSTRPMTGRALQVKNNGRPITGRSKATSV